MQIYILPNVRASRSSAVAPQKKTMTQTGSWATAGLERAGRADPEPNHLSSYLTSKMSDRNNKCSKIPHVHRMSNEYARRAHAARRCL